MIIKFENTNNKITHTTKLIILNLLLTYEKRLFNEIIDVISIGENSSFKIENSAIKKFLTFLYFDLKNINNFGKIIEYIMIFTYNLNPLNIILIGIRKKILFNKDETFSNSEFCDLILQQWNKCYSERKKYYNNFFLNEKNTEWYSLNKEFFFDIKRIYLEKQNIENINNNNKILKENKITLWAYIILTILLMLIEIITFLMLSQ